MFTVRKEEHNPILAPVKMNGWEDLATCNGCPIMVEDTMHMLYRAISEPDRMQATDLQNSTIGHVVFKDGLHPTDRRQLIFPEYEWEKYGCEDPRVTKLGDTYYIFYTALSTYPLGRDGIKLAVATTKDFKKILKKAPVTTFNSKAMAMFPDKINGKMTAILTTDTDAAHSKIAIAQFSSFKQMTDPAFWDAWYADIDSHAIDSLQRSDNDHVEVGAPPIKTDKGWLLIYSHIQEFFHGTPILGIEACLLDLKDPKKVLKRTTAPFIVPEEMYEKFGIVGNVTFPSGALVRGEYLDVYYGAADTTTCKATIRLNDLLEAMDDEKAYSHVVRYDKNPILIEDETHPWEALDVLNPGAIELGGMIRIAYRGMSFDNTSMIGYAATRDGVTIYERSPEPMYWPRTDNEAKKSGPTGYSGCEDPRLTKIGDRIYMLYTAYNGVEPPRVAISSISEDDFRQHRWKKWSKPSMLTPQGIDDKDACLFSEQIKGKYAILHRVSHHICLDYLPSLDFSKYTVMRCIEVMGPRRGMWDGEKVGIAGPPIKTDKGWLLLYHGVSHSSVYSVGAALLKIDDPTTVIARTVDPILVPTMEYELKGQVNNVVFPCGNVLRDDTIFIYYGGADSVVCVATASLSTILERLLWK